MGLLDVPGVPAALQPRRAPNPLIGKLRRGKENAVLQFLGDSTGDGVTRHPYLTAVLLGAKYPTHNVDYYYWNIANTSYDALGSGLSARLQTGSAPSPATIVDTTVRANSASSPGNTSDANAFPWFPVTGTYGITSNRIVPLSANAVTSLSTQYADHTGSITVAATNSTTVRFYVRFKTSTDTLFASIGITGSSGVNLFIFKVIAGVTTSVAFATVNLALSTDHTLSWVCSGKTVSFTIGGQTASYTLTDADYQAGPALATAPNIGMFGSSGLGISWTNLSVTPQAPTLTVRSGSGSGKTCVYSQTNFTAQVPGRPDVTIINYGHNEGFQDARPAYLRLLDQLLAYYPKTAVLCTVQNPRARTAMEYAEAVARNNSINTLAVNDGHGVIDVESAFLADPAYAVNLLNPDGLHPSPAGSAVWAAENMKALDPAAVVPFRVAATRESTVFLPAAAMQAVEGSPVFGLANGWPSWALDPTTQQSVMGFADVPPTWEIIDVWFLWTTSVASGLTGSTNQVWFEVLLGSLNAAPGYVVGTPNAGSPIASAAFGLGFPINNFIPYTQQSTLLGVTSAFVALGGLRPAGRPLAVQARRVAASANDTVTAAVNLQGVLIKRVA